MDLRDFEKSTSLTKFSKLNKRLHESYGVSVSEGATYDELFTLLNTVKESIGRAKFEGLTINDESVAMNTLLKEAIITRMGEIPDKHQSRQEEIYNNILDGLCDFACKCIDLGDDYDDAIDLAMKEYRSSPYRFEDEKVRSDLEYRVGDGLINSNTEMGEMKDKQFNIKEGYVKQLRTLLESEVEEAEIVIATKGFSKSLQEMIEKVGRLQNEDLPPLSDQMRANYDIEIAQNFHEKTQGTLQSVLDSLYYAREEIDHVVQNMAVGNMDWETDMESDSEDFENAEGDALDSELGDLEVDADADIEAGVEDGVDDLESELSDLESEIDDEPLGRVRKESIQALRAKMDLLKEQVEKRKKAK